MEKVTVELVGRKKKVVTITVDPEVKKYISWLKVVHGEAFSGEINRMYRKRMARDKAYQNEDFREYLAQKYGEQKDKPKFRMTREKGGSQKSGDRSQEKKK